MPRISGNTMRPSMAEDDGCPINNLPGRYTTEDWVVHYWDVGPDGELHSRQVVIQLPKGYAHASARVAIGEPGCVHRVRRWGVQLYTRILQDIGFDPALYVGRRGTRSSDGGDAELISILIQATHFDLPAHFIIASAEHPLLLFGPQGLLRGSYTRSHTHLGATVYLLTEGEVNGTFGRLHGDNRALYQRALADVLQALRQQKDF